MRKVTIATRGSKLALWQAEHVKARLLAHSDVSEVELLVLKTKGDKILDVPLAKVGGKGLFVKEIEMALLDGRADVAVHSMKDVPAELEKGLHLAAMSARANPHDALCSARGTTLDELPVGAIVGTSSLRRSCQLRLLRPDLEIKSLRGNVQTRLAKMDAGEYDAIVLAAAGLERLELADRITEELPIERSLPAVGQGVLGIETRADDQATSSLVAEVVNDPAEWHRVAAERAFLHKLEGGCQAPMAAHARYQDGELRIDAFVGRPDGSQILRATRTGSPADDIALGEAVAADLLEKGAGPILQELIEAAQRDET
jgi:hydroxymethylbilane synthase